MERLLKIKESYIKQHGLIVRAKAFRNNKLLMFIFCIYWLYSLSIKNKSYTIKPSIKYYF